MKNNYSSAADIPSAIAEYLQRNSFGLFAPKAALIDMDGTLLDSMKGHTLAWERMISELGIPCTREEFYLYEGMTGEATIDMLFRRHFHRPATEKEMHDLYAIKTGYFNELPKVPIVEGADRMVSTLRSLGIERVLVTGSGQLSSLNRLNDDFPGGFSDELRVTSHDVVNGKPSPEPYLKAMQLAATDPWQSIAIENAPLGVKSAAGARAFTIAVTTGPIPAEEMWKAGADMVIESMNQLAEMLPEIVAGGSTK